MTHYKNILVKIGSHTEKRTIHHDAEYDKEGREIRPAWDEEIEVEVDDYEAQNVPFTPEEEQEWAERQAEEEERQRLAPPTDAERISAMEDVILEMLGGNV